MKYRAKVTHCVSQILNLTAYQDAKILEDTYDMWIDVDTAEEAAAIEMFDHYMGMAILKYQRLEEITSKKI